MVLDEVFEFRSSLIADFFLLRAASLVFKF
jgi:hypothetical protein